MDYNVNQSLLVAPHLYAVDFGRKVLAEILGADPIIKIVNNRFTKLVFYITYLTVKTIEFLRKIE